MKTNFLIIGSGIAGLNFALNAAKKGKVTIITKKKSINSATNFAQGGIATVLEKTDNFQKHIEDTIKAGAGLNNREAVELMVKKSPEAIKKLMKMGVAFASKKGNLIPGHEGGHSEKRIAHVGDHTGEEIEKVLINKVKSNPNIEVLENTFALDLIINKKSCYGCIAIKRNKIISILADQTILATGGSGQIYKYTTNPKIATGDGVAMAIRAGCKAKDMEFVQFHPTAFAKKLSPMFLISETVRGEGAKLVNKSGERITKNELASRDTVAKEIYKELKKSPVYLNITHKKEPWLKNRFPTIFRKLEKHGYNIAKKKIPITPAAHYQCGGIEADLNGKTSIKNLFTFGEVASTGVHGANRLASNSLLEALVFSDRIVKELKKIPTEEFEKIKIAKPEISPPQSTETKKAKEAKKKIQELMWRYAGIIRNRKEVEKTAIPKMKKIHAELSKIKSINPDIAEAKNMALVGTEILQRITERKSSSGCHFIED